MEYESQEWLDSLTDEEYEEYRAQKILNHLDYLASEGFLKTKLDEDGQTLYCLKSDEEINAEIESI